MIGKEQLPLFLEPGPRKAPRESWHRVVRWKETACCPLSCEPHHFNFSNPSELCLLEIGAYIFSQKVDPTPKRSASHMSTKHHLAMKVIRLDGWTSQSVVYTVCLGQNEIKIEILK